MNTRHYNDPRIVYIAEEPYFKGMHKLSDKQIRKIIFGNWRRLDDVQTIKKLRKSEMMNTNRIKYHLKNKSILRDDKNTIDVIRIRLAVIEDIISGLRKDKAKLKKKLLANAGDVDDAISEGYNLNNGY